MGRRQYHGLDTMQVCLNGHQITPAADQMPEQRQAFCTKCGAETITACPECKNDIPGVNWDSGFIGVSSSPPPKYCLKCGTAYPWQQSAIANAIGVLEELGIDDADLSMAKTALPELIAATPKTELAALRFKRALSKLGQPAYDIGIQVVSDIVSETVKKMLTKT